MTHGRVIDARLDHKLARDANCEHHDTLPSVYLPILVLLRLIVPRRGVGTYDCIALHGFPLSFPSPGFAAQPTDALPATASSKLLPPKGSVPKASSITSSSSSFFS
jgi:hypothetical protein